MATYPNVTVKSCERTESGKAATLAWQSTNPDPPPATVESTVTVSPISDDFYEDLRTAKVSGSELEVEVDDGDGRVVRVKFL